MSDTTKHVLLRPHNPRWPKDFARESAAILTAFGTFLTEIHHIGGTAIPGIHAKPIIDMLAVTSDITLLDAPPRPLANLGYEALGEFGIPGRHFFRKTNAAGERTHHLRTF
jgi:GrpB-like predicted nucleotidyltransferase (UPF0157 family)